MAARRHCGALVCRTNEMPELILGAAALTLRL